MSTTNAISSQAVELYDTTLRDGAQAEGVTLSLVDKLKIARRLDDAGFNYIEGGYPLSNPKDEAFFAEARKICWHRAKICAFGMTRRRGILADADPGMRALVGSGAPVITIVGKTWDLHVDDVLRVSRQENLDMIQQSLAFCRDTGAEVFYDAEHFFDGYRTNPEYAIQTLLAAVEGGATRLVLCDTNGGSLPSWINQTVREVMTKIAVDQTGTVRLAIHAHNDCGLAVANTLTALETGCVQAQGTINGIGERCGNVDLITVAANLALKLEQPVLESGSLPKLTELSRFVSELANQNLAPNQPYVGTSAFAHKGGMHVHAVQRIAHSYEHVPPEKVGNSRRVLVSELSGASNIAAALDRKFNIEGDRQVQRKVLQRVQELEHRGYQFEAALASFELLVYEALGKNPQLWDLNHYRCVIYKRVGEPASTEAIVRVRVGMVDEHRVADGDGPVNALDGALRRCLMNHYPQIKEIHLTDYKVRVVNPTAESAAKVRALAEFEVRGNDGQVQRQFATIGVNENIVDASWEAISSAFRYHLIETAATPPTANADPC